MMSVRLPLIVLTLTISSVICTPSLNYPKFYSLGVKAYENGSWSECVENIKASLDGYRLQKEIVLDCANFCNLYETTLSTADILLGSNAQFGLPQTTACFNRCWSNNPHVSGIAEDGLDETGLITDTDVMFLDLKPYEYLQICAYNLGELKAAVAAAYTLSEAFPDHPYINDNLQLFAKSSELQPEDFTSMEPEHYSTNYRKAVESYQAGDYEGCIKLMEMALTNFYSSLHDCATLCMKSLVRESTISLPSIQSFSADDIRNNGNIVEKLRTVLNASLLDALSCGKYCYHHSPDGADVKNKTDVEVNSRVAEAFNYLQFSYYKVGDIDNAVRCVETGLLFDPTSNTFAFNKDYYSGLPTVTPEQFVARKDASQHLSEKRRITEAHFKLSTLTTSSSTADILDSGGSKHADNDPVGRVTRVSPKDDGFLESFEQFAMRNGVSVAFELETSGVVLDGLIDPGRVLDLMHMYEVAVSNGLISQESCLDVETAIKITEMDLIEVQSLRLWLDIIELIRSSMEKYVKMSTPLYVKSFLMCCDRGQAGAASGFIDGWLEESKSRGSSSYDGQEILSVLLLNDDYSDGKLTLTSSEGHRHILREILPLYGRLLGLFTSDAQLHFSPVSSGSRCLVTALLSDNPAQQSNSHVHALMSLASLTTTPQSSSMDSELRRFLEVKGYRITLTETQLNGKERFVAENVLSQAQCQRLIDLANAGAITSDGYQTKGRSSPHTNHERFIGLTLSRAAELAVEQKVNIAAVQLYLEASEAARQLAISYFSLQQLYFSYIHLVCRTSLNVGQARQDLSHPIHNDNGVLQPDGSTLRERPAYTERDYSAIVYLNGDFEGGDFFFAGNDFTMQSSLHPACGQAVVFNATSLHGVRAVSSGQRCALAIWFTMDRDYADNSPEYAQNLIDGLYSRAYGPPLDLQMDGRATYRDEL